MVLRFLYMIPQSLATVTAVSSGLYILYVDHERYPKMIRRYESGCITGLTAVKESQGSFVRRPEVEKKLHEALGGHYTNRYYVIRGESGSGKSRLIQELIRNRIAEVPKSGDVGAPIYVHVAQGLNVTNTLATAVDFNFDEHLNFQYFINTILMLNTGPVDGEYSKLMRLLNAIEESSIRYQQKHNKPAVLVIDDADQLSAVTENGLAIVQTKAKLWADSNICKLVLVVNSEDSVESLQSNPAAWSRASTIFIQDLTREEAMCFLRGYSSSSPLNSDKKNPKGMSEEEAELVFETVGGRSQYLVMCDRDYKNGIPIETTLGSLKEKEREKLLDVEKDPLKKAIIEHLLNLNKSNGGAGVRVNELVSMTGLDNITQLAKKDILKFTEIHSGQMSVDFESMLTEVVAKELFPGFAK